MEAEQRMVALTQALADPLRLEMLRVLMGGAATVSELTALTGASQPNVSNHLAVLRERGLVRATREGRQMRYDVRDAAVANLIEALAAVAEAPTRRPQERMSPQLAQARMCYDHLAGEVGVGVYDALLARGALLANPVAGARRDGSAGASAAVELSSAGEALFGDLGIDVAALRHLKRRLAFACVDWTERRPHLGGALGAALGATALARGWVVRQPETRAVIVTDAGWRGLRAALGVELQLAGEAR